MVSPHHHTFVHTQRMDLRNEPKQRREGLGGDGVPSGSSTFANVHPGGRW